MGDASGALVRQSEPSVQQWYGALYSTAALRLEIMSHKYSIRLNKPAAARRNINSIVIILKIKAAEQRHIKVTPYHKFCFFYIFI
jgi:hypothetical protein